MSKHLLVGLLIFFTGCSTANNTRDLDTGCEFEFKGKAEVLKLECNQNWDTDENSESTGTVTAPAIGK